MVLVDEVSEGGSALDAVCRGGESDDVRVVIGGAEAELVALVAVTLVVVFDVTVQDDPQVAFGGDEHPVGAFCWNSFHSALGVGVHSRCLRCGLHDLDSGGGEDCVEGGGGAAVAVANQMGESLAGVLEVEGELVGELGGP